VNTTKLWLEIPKQTSQITPQVKFWW